MKLLFVVNLLLTLNIGLKSQNNFETYSKVTLQAELNLKERNYLKSIELYKDAFAFLQYPYNKDLLNFAQAALQTDSLTLVSDAIKKAIRNGYPYKDIKKKSELKGFFKSSFFKNEVPSFDSLDLAYQRSINQAYLYKIDSLVYIDQLLRNNKPFKFKLDKLTMEKIKQMEPESVDDSNFRYLMELIEKFGFPSDRNVGESRYGRASIVILHNARLKKNNTYLQILKGYVDTGEYLYRDYNYLLEQSQNIRKNATPYVN